MQEITATSILSLLETDKGQRQSFANQVVQAIKEGAVDPRKILLQLKCTEDLIKQIKDDEDFKAVLIEEAAKQGKKHEFFNSSMEIKETGITYDWSKCNDVKLIELAAQLKARQAMLKSLPPSGLIVTDEETGETTTIYPPAKSSTTSVAVTLK